MPNDYHHAHKQRVESGQARSPENKSKIVIEGVDEPKPPEPSSHPGVIDPWGKDYPYKAGAREMLKQA